MSERRRVSNCLYCPGHLRNSPREHLRTIRHKLVGVVEDMIQCLCYIGEKRRRHGYNTKW
ncbi:hypothetical protein K443DRAFT_397221 [Laccaria amethystina LaAM-08-1]|uniref:Uncharacterized protein n=1 Tax=Laccaria amethystina LaAM-08-1 TaxID=1095629 RepID=A0A0C9WIS8_9AGAR|nr:hypothetical protein K443DRAFT_397221 [Laccaria amethystina LaAM-08-1]